MALEGGYHLQTLGDCILAVLDELAGVTQCAVSHFAEQADRKKVNYAIYRCVHVHRQFWKCFGRPEQMNE
jgi:hypothetical protein